MLVQRLCWLPCCSQHCGATWRQCLSSLNFLGGRRICADWLGYQSGSQTTKTRKDESAAELKVILCPPSPMIAYVAWAASLEERRSRFGLCRVLGCRGAARDPRM